MDIVINTAQPVRIALSDAISLCRKLEAAAGVVVSEGLVTPTRKLLELVATALDAIGAQGCTLDGAWMFWKLVNMEAEAAREANTENADLAFWYGVNPFELDDDQRVALLTNLPRIKAQDALKRGSFDPMDMNHVYALVLAATGDQQQAQKAKADAAELRVTYETEKAARNGIR